MKNVINKIHKVEGMLREEYLIDEITNKYTDDEMTVIYYLLDITIGIVYDLNELIDTPTGEIYAMTKEMINKHIIGKYKKGEN